MKVLFAWLLTVVLGFGAETVAWKIPVEVLVEGGTGNARMTRLKEAPGDSVFFTEGDELWDLTKVAGLELEQMRILESADELDPFAAPSEVEAEFEKVRKIGFGGDFLVWNERSGQIVARGSAADIRFVDDWIGLSRRARQVRTTVMIEKGGGNRGFSLMARSGEKAEARQEEFEMQLAPNLSEDSKVADLTLQLGFLQGDHRVEVTTSCTLNVGEKRRLARWVLDGKVCEARVLVDVVYPWGVLHSEVRMEEEGASSSYEAFDPQSLDGLDVGSDHRVKVFPVPGDLVQRICKKDIEVLPWELPKELKDRLPAKMLDVREPLRMNGVKFSSELAVAGFDPRAGLLVVVNDFENLDLLETIVGHGCGVPEVLEIAVDWGADELSCVTRSGEKVHFLVKRGDQELVDFEAAPNVSADRQWIDVLFSLSVPEDGILLNSAATLLNGRAVDIVERSGDEKSGTISLKATVMDLGHGH